MRIHLNQPHAVSNPSSTPLSKPQTSFAKVLSNQQKQAVAILDLKRDLHSTAQDLKSGKINAEEAAKAFAELILEKRNTFKLSDKNLQVVKQSIGDIVSKDPHLLAKIETQLKLI